MLGVAANWDTASTTSASVYRRVESATRTFARTAGLTAGGMKMAALIG